MPPEIDHFHSSRLAAIGSTQETVSMPLRSFRLPVDSGEAFFEAANRTSAGTESDS
jgi:hypothetical protein